MYLLGVDVGTTNWKVIAFTSRGEAVASFSCPTRTHWEEGGRAVYHAAEVWEGVCAGIRAVLDQLGPDRAREVAGIAVASIGEAGVLLDGAGEPALPVMAWFDPRTEPQERWWREVYGAERAYRITGFPPKYIASANKILWWREHEPEAFARARRWLCMADYVAWRLTGEMAMDYSLASRTLLFDIRRRRWSEELLAATDLPASLFPEPVPSGTRLGRVSGAAARATGLPEHVVVAAGGHDHICGALAAGVVAPGDALDSMGTAEAVLLVLEEPALSDALLAHGYTLGCHTARDRYYLMGGLRSAGGAIEWLKGLFPDLGEGEAFYRALAAEAGQSPPGSRGCRFLPHLTGMVHPPAATVRAAWLGLGLGHRRPDLLRAVIEGLALEAALNLTTMARLAAQPLRRVLAIGGGARNELWLQIKAATLPCPLEVHPVAEATALGAAVLAGLAAGVYPDEAGALRQLARKGRAVEPPDGLAAVYGPLLESHAALDRMLQEAPAGEPSAGRPAPAAPTEKAGRVP